MLLSTCTWLYAIYFKVSIKIIQYIQVIILSAGTLKRYVHITYSIITIQYNVSDSESGHPA